MGEPHVISALKRKRAVISGELAEAEKRCQRMRDYLSALDNTLRLFGYDGDPATIKPVRPHRTMFRRGDLQRAVLDALRAAEGPVSNQVIAERINTTTDRAERLAAVLQKPDARKRLERRFVAHPIDILEIQGAGVCRE
jgi:hypothetical protein